MLLISKKKKKKRKRARETEQETAERKTKNRCLMSTVRASAKPIDAIIEEFIAKVKIGPDYVCTSCHRMLYKHTVVQFKPSKYTKASSELLDKLSEHAYVSKIHGKQWVCKTCDGSLSRDVIPTQAKANGMELDDERDELKCLNALERRLIALRVSFMKMVALPTGKQKCIHGPAVNVPSKVHCVCEVLPRLPSECELVPLKLKRKLSYKGHYLCDYVSPEKLSSALRWLKANNSLYANIKIADDWVDNAIADDEELVMSMLEQDEPMDDSEVSNDNSSEPQPMDVINSKEKPVDDNGGNKFEFASNSANLLNVPSGSDPVSVYAKVLTEFVRGHGLAVHDVPRDGNCMFSSVAYQLQNIGHDVNESTLRQRCVHYLAENSEFFSHFVHQSVASNDGYNADNEALTEEDAYIESVVDPVVQHELRWQKYLRRLSEGAWGDQIALTAICMLFDVKVNGYSASQNGTNVNTLNDCGKREVNIGLIMQFHFVGLDKPSVPIATKMPISAPLVHTQSSGQCGDSDKDDGDSGNNELDDATIAEGDQHRLEITGSIHASMLTLENPEQIVSIAPAEGQKPLFIMSDPQFELLCNPDKFCYGNGGFSKERPRKLTYRKYFNARLLDIDGRFARDLDYLFVAQYIVESKQVLDDGNNFAWRQKPNRSFTASQVQDTAFLSQHVPNDKAYRFLKNVRGSPPYYQRTFYDLLAMIRQLGTPTWFFTLSAADMKWPDMIQIIARQYGEHFSDEHRGGSRN